MSGEARLHRGDQGVQGERGTQGKQGVQGQQGKQGVQGERGLSPAVRRAIIYLVLLMLLASGLNLLWTYRVVSQNNADRCASIIKLAEIPIPHPIAGNPSREFAASLEHIYRQRAHELGCL